MGFFKDTNNRDWSWDNVDGWSHIRLTNGRMLRVREVHDLENGNYYALELMTPHSAGWMVVMTRGGATAPVSWLQSYAEYVFAGQEYVDG